MRKTNIGADGPEPFEALIAEDTWGAVVLSAAAILDGEVQQQQRDRHGHDAGDGAEEEEQRVHAFGRGRGLLGEQRYVGKHFKALKKTAG